MDNKIEHDMETGLYRERYCLTDWSMVLASFTRFSLGVDLGLAGAGFLT